MTERMTDRDVELCEESPGLDSDEAEVVLTELKAARAEEARLLEVAKAKDERIQALEATLSEARARQHELGVALDAARAKVSP